jgi:molybdopterin converting factor small subunit
MKLTVEFLGLAHQMAQTKECSITLPNGATYRDTLRELASLYPALLDSVIIPQTYNLVSAYMLNSEGRYAVSDLDTPVQDGQLLLLMFVEAGG